tara:strand:+ start:433 stop:1140 length:708 start_codon:yes stop_codon:yes gene_type:complete
MQFNADDGFEFEGRPYDYANMLIDAVPDIIGGTLAQAAELTLADIAILAHSGISTHIPDPKIVYHTVSDAAASELVGFASINAIAFEAAMQVCSRNLVNDYPLPLILRQWASLRVLGTAKTPPSRMSPPKNFVQRWLIYAGILQIKDVYGLDFSVSDGSGRPNACEVISEALGDHDLHFPEIRLRDWCNHKDHAAFRELAGALSNYVMDAGLQKAGLLRVANPNGMFASLSRSPR